MLFCLKNPITKPQQIKYQHLNQNLFSTEYHWHHHLKT